jgi:hypothetical protein
MIHLRSIAAFAAAAMLTAAPVFAKTTVVADTMSGGSMHMAMKPACPPPARFGGGVYCGAPKLTNTLSLIVAGGGPAKFSTVTAFGVLADGKAAAEEAKLIKMYGKPAFLQYIKTFDFVISDSLAIVTKAKVPLPKAPVPDPKNGKALSAALYTDGVGPMGTYSVEYMLDHLVTHPIHVQVMKDIDAKYGLSADAAYHAVTLQIFKDLKAVYGL